MVSEQWLRACKATAQLLPVDRFLLSTSARAGKHTRALVQHTNGLNTVMPAGAGTFREPGARVPAASAPAKADVKDSADEVDSAWLPAARIYPLLMRACSRLHLQSPDVLAGTSP